VVGYLHEIGAELPWLTVALIETSTFVASAWPLLIGVPAGLAVAAAAIARASPDAARRLDAAKLRLPLIGPVLRKLALSRFTHFFSVLFHSGVPILTCLATAGNVVGNRSLAAALDRVAEGVSSGGTLARSLEATGAFPGLVVRMVKVGEETGRLLDTLDNVTYFYDREVDEAVSGMIGALEPAVTAVLGALLAWVAVAVLGPIYDSFGSIG
jgi:type IV pilus assembly protein PilC